MLSWSRAGGDVFGRLTGSSRRVPGKRGRAIELAARGEFGPALFPIDEELRLPGTDYTVVFWFRHQVVTTVGTGGQRLHMDGRLLATGKLTKRTRTSNRLGLDLGPGSGDATVTMDELQIFGRALAETEVIRLSD